MNWRRNLAEYIAMRKQIAEYGVPRSIVARWLPLASMLVTVVLAILFGVLTQQDVILPNSEGTNIATAVLAGGAFVIAYQQWRAARYEASLDKFYDRLHLANASLEKLAGVDPFDMYVFAELDNLEYVIEKYKWGYVSIDHTLRALRTFQSRCEQDLFREKALFWVEHAAYQPATLKVARNIAISASARANNRTA